MQRKEPHQPLSLYVETIPNFSAIQIFKFKFFLCRPGTFQLRLDLQVQLNRNQSLDQY